MEKDTTNQEKRKDFSRKEYNITFSTYDSYSVQADSQQEAINKAYKELSNDRYRSVANLHCDELDVEEIEDEEDNV